ncbi:MAG: hypothetical protein LQ337_006761 [Flavoplaca oasis]|nr:MAG: hypothetical protein LQ337_006761 [Flavoplaca oasis]
MSGAEALVAIGIIANTVGVIDFSSKIIGRIKDAGENVQNVPKAFRDVQSTLPLLSHALNQTQRRIETGALDEEACSALKPVLQDCSSDISQLNGIFDRCLPKDGSSKLHRGWKAAISLRQDKKVEEISELIQKRVQFLTYHHVAAPQSSAMATNVLSANIEAMHITNEKSPKIYSMIPVQWAEDFIGRHEQMSSLTSILSQPNKHHRVAVVGLGGIGKTRLVRQYIETQREPNTSVFWIHAGTAERMGSGSRDIANEVGIQGCNDPDTDILKKVKDWFEGESSGKWLLIYDNVDDIDLMYGQQHGRLAAYIPRSNRGSIIMTTRNRQIGIKFATVKNTISLSDLTEADSISLMTTRLGESNPEDEPELKRLVQVLGGIPLAINQAISFIQENGSNLARYLELYEANDSNRVELLSQDFEDDTRDHELKNPIASTWIVTFEYMKAHQPLAADTLCMMSMFDAQAIPEAFISKTAGGSPTAVERTLGVLQAYSLINLRQDTSTDARHEHVGRTFDLHRLVRLVTRNWLTEWSNRDMWLARAIDMMSIRYDEINTLDEATQYKITLQYMPHALILVSSPPLSLQEDEEVHVPDVFSGQTIMNDHAEDGAICPSCTGKILASMIELNLSVSRCLRMTQKAIAICNLCLGGYHVTTLSLRGTEALCMDLLGDFSRAEMIHQEVLVGYESALGSSNRSTLIAGFGLVCNLQIQGKYDEAERLLLRLEKTACQEYGQADSETIKVMQALSDNMISQGRDEEALEKCSEISTLVKTTSDKLKLAKVYTRCRQYSSAEAMLLNLLKDEDGLREDLWLDDVWSSLADVYFNERLYDKAESLQRQVLTHRQHTYGRDNDRTQEAMFYLARTLYKLGPDNYHEVEFLALKVKEASSATPIKSHTAAWCLAKVWLRSGKYDDAKKLALQYGHSTLAEKLVDATPWVKLLGDVWGINPDGIDIYESGGLDPQDTADRVLDDFDQDDRIW